MADEAPHWTPFRYCYNNPVIITDPTGMKEGGTDWENENEKDAENNWEEWGSSEHSDAPPAWVYTKSGIDYKVTVKASKAVRAAGFGDITTYKTRTIYTSFSQQVSAFEDNLVNTVSNALDFLTPVDNAMAKEDGAAHNTMKFVNNLNPLVGLYNSGSYIFGNGKDMSGDKVSGLQAILGIVGLGLEGEVINVGGKAISIGGKIAAKTGIKTANGIKITGFTRHGLDRIIERGIKPSAILDALKNPLKTGKVITDAAGRQSQRFIGQFSEVVINPLTGKILSANPTSSKVVAKLLKQ